MDDDRERRSQRLPGWSARGVRFHAERWLLLAGVAAITCVVFPAPRVPSSPVYDIGEVARQTIIAPIPFVVRKSDDEIAREGEARALAVPPVYRFSVAGYAAALDAARAFFDARPPATSIVPDLSQAQPATRLDLSPDETAWLADPAHRRLTRDAVLRFLSRSLLLGVADVGALKAEHRERITVMRGDSERVIPRDSVRTFSDLMAEAERAVPDGAGLVGERTFRRLVAGFFYPTIVADPDLTERRREPFRSGVDSIKFAVPAGARIVGARELVSTEVRDKLLGMRDALRRRGTEGALNATTLAGPFLYDAMVLAPFWLLIMLYRRETYRSAR